MLVPGHLAAAALAAAGGVRTGALGASVRRVLLPAVLGGLTPDLIDKTRMAMGGSIYGRTVGHSLLFMVGITVGWLVLRRLSRPWAVLAGFWVLGVWTHLAADLVDDALRGWMSGGMMASTWFAWPWATPYTRAIYAHETHWTGWSWPVTPIEAVVVLGAVAWFAAFATRRPAGSAESTA